jgi:hypothetical protein
LSNKKKVIPFPQSERWTFYDWVDLGGTNPIEKWLAEQSDEVRMYFTSMLKDAQKTREYRQWTGYRHPMTGRAGKAGVHELGFKAEGIQYRILIKFDGLMQSVLLCGCYHKGKRWTPEEAPDTAADRAKALTQGKATKRERKIEDDL